MPQADVERRDMLSMANSDRVTLVTSLTGPGAMRDRNARTSREQLLSFVHS